MASPRAFVKLREILATHKDLARKLQELEKNMTSNSGLFLKLSDNLWSLKKNQSEGSGSKHMESSVLLNSEPIFSSR